MNKKVVSLSLAGLIAFSSVGVYAKGPVTSPGVVTTELGQEINVKIDKKNLATPNVKGDVKITIPIFKGLKNPEFQKKLNQKIETKAKKDLDQYKKEVLEAEKVQSAADDSQLIIDFSIKARGKINSLIVEKYSITKGQANGELTRDYYNIDVINNREVNLADLFKKDSNYKELLNKEIKDLINKNKEAYFPMEKTEDNEEVLGFKGVDETSKFYLNKVGDLVIAFDLYEIAPRSTGYPEFVIPAYKLDSILEDKDLVSSIFTTRTIAETNKNNLSIAFPEIKGLLNPKFEKDLNEGLLNYINSEVKNFEDEAKTRKLKDSTSELYIDYEVTFENKEGASFKITSYKYLAGDANGENKIKYYNLDLKENKLLSLKDIFKSDANYKEVINKFIASEIAKDKDSYFQGEDGFKSIKDDQSFYFDENMDLIVAFDQYEIGPRTSGSPEFKIPREIIKNIIK